MLGLFITAGCIQLRGLTYALYLLTFNFYLWSILINSVLSFYHRYLQRLKSYVRNRAHPEGSIAEGYMAEECLTFCSRYLDSVETVFNRPSRNVEDASGSITNFELDQKSWTQAHRYVLFNSDEIIPYRM